MVGGRIVLRPYTSIGKSKNLAIFEECSGIPLIFSAIQYWERLLQRLGIQKEFARVLAATSVMFLPLAFLAIRHWPYRTLSAFWAVWLALCDSLIILLSWRAWDAFVETRSPVIDMLETAPAAELDALESSYLRAFRWAPQLCVCGIAALVTLWVALQLPSPVVERVPVTIVSLIVSGFVAGHAFYFIIYTALMCRRVSRIPNLQLRWNDPINTPGLLALSRANQFEAQMGMILFFVVVVPLTYAYIKVHNTDVRLLYIFEMVLPLVCIIVIGLVVQGWLAAPARKLKRTTLGEISASIDTLRAGRAIGMLQSGDLAQIKEQLEVYELLTNSADSFFRGGVITQYLASVGAATVPFIIAFLLRQK